MTRVACWSLLISAGDRDWYQVVTRTAEPLGSPVMTLETESLKAWSVTFIDGLE